MIEKHLKVLNSHDDPLQWECPIDFDYKTEQQSFYEARDRLQSVLRTKLEVETGVCIQDASYHSLIKLNGDLLINTQEYAQVRFSNFGKLIAFLNEDAIKESIRIDIIQHLDSLGYTYIPEKVLNTYYPGNNRGLNGIDTWWIRYFDWV